MSKTKPPQKNPTISKITVNATIGRKSLGTIRTLHGLPREIVRLLAVEEDEVDLEEYFYLTSIMLKLLERNRAGGEGDDV